MNINGQPTNAAAKHRVRLGFALQHKLAAATACLMLLFSGGREASAEVVWGAPGTSGAYANARGDSFQEAFGDVSAIAYVDRGFSSSLAMASVVSGKLQVFGHGQAQWYDYLTFHATEPNMGSTFRAHLNASVHGTIDSRDGTGGGASWGVAVTDGVDSLTMTASWQAPGMGVYSTETSNFYSSNVHGDWIKDSINDKSWFFGTIDLAFEKAVYVAMDLSGFNVDFSHTATLGLELPTGVTFTSASGRFLSQPESQAEVPEPATLLLTSLAILILGAIRREIPTC